MAIELSDFDMDLGEPLNTIQKQEKLNLIYTADEPGPGGAHHEYLIAPVDDIPMDYTDTGEIDENGDHIMVTNCNVPAWIFFQRGPRDNPDSQHGIIDSDLLEIVRDRLKSFQAGPFSSEYNAEALYHVEEALKAMNRRVEDRIARNVLGKDVK